MYVIDSLKEMAYVFALPNIKGRANRLLVVSISI